MSYNKIINTFLTEMKNYRLKSEPLFYLSPQLKEPLEV